MNLKINVLSDESSSFVSDVAADERNIGLSVILSTYNQPLWLEKVLWGYEVQTDRRFEVIIADDGSDERTCRLIEKIKPLLSFPVRHVWHPNDGFRKCVILNKAILEASAPYLLFSDGDCIPRMDFVAVHLKYRKKGHFLSGGYFKLTLRISHEISKDDILSGKCFNINWLKSKGLQNSFKNNKLTSFGWKEKLLNFITTTKPTWNGHNASGWLEDILAVNGFNEQMKYGGEDREFGERLENNGIKGLQIRYSAICVHLDHSRSYKTQDAIQMNNEIRKNTRKYKLKTTPYGIVKNL
jgi:glycosyltransferase involved in cell wall biosynthesis